MAKAAEDQIKTATQMAELSRNIDLYDKRFAIVKFLIENTFWIVCSRHDFIIELKLLFPSENIQNILIKFLASYYEAKEVDEDYNLFITESFSHAYNFELIQEQIESALEAKEDGVEIERARELAEQHIITFQKDDENLKRLNLFEILKSRLVKESETDIIKDRLVSAMISYIEATLSMKKPNA